METRKTTLSSVTDLESLKEIIATPSFRVESKESSRVLILDKNKLQYAFVSLGGIFLQIHMLLY